MANYTDQARQQLNASKNNKINAYKNQLAESQLALEQQKTGINSAYDQQVNAQNLNNRLNKNNISNAMLGRGLGNSSVALSGLAESDAKNTRLVGNINQSRTADLGNIDAQKAQLARNTNATISQINNDFEDQVLALARQLEDRAFDKDFRNRQLALQREQMNATNAYNNARLAFEREKYNQAMAEKNKPENPQDVLASLRMAAMEDPLKAGRLYSTKYSSVPGMEYVVKEAEEYAKNHQYYKDKWINKYYGQ